MCRNVHKLETHKCHPFSRAIKTSKRHSLFFSCLLHVDNLLFLLHTRYVPLFTVRRKKRAKRRRKGIAGVIDSFNASHTGVVVRVDRVSGDLLICEALVDPPPHSRSAQEAWVSQ